MSKVEIDLEKISNPPPKVLLMYEAVVRLLRGKEDIGSLKVVDITNEAGIGKGTAYEYFSSKEEVISCALVYDYGRKLEALARKLHEAVDFKKQCYKVMDWILENREYNMMFSKLLKGCMGEESACSSISDFEGNALFEAMHDYILEEIDKLMSQAFAQGVIDETNVQKQRIAFVTAMVQYGFMLSYTNRSVENALTDEQLREFVYNGLTKILTTS